ncbi:MAG: two component transcriptional regulator, winged helix family [Ignavibacteriaceae bacterium]|jgi:DNA-binding response OmpR family regulator|nr:two component transcriptional regulator, winged helix family [Ignavibacteriaceae bacterium]
MRILVIEDEKGIANFLRDGLTEEYFAVDVAYDGKTGLQMALSNEYDLLLIDWMLPGLSGIEIVKNIRKVNPAIPVIFLTARDTIDDTVFGLESGANDYIKKPFQFAELLARIKVQLRSKNLDNGYLVLGPIKLSADTHQVYKDDVEITLTQKEFSLLEYLMRNKGKVCTRTKIIEHIWDIHFDADTSVIDVYINFIRKKLGLGPKEFIFTLRGVGYIAKEE